MKYEAKINDHYNELSSIYGYSKAGIGWKSDKLNSRYEKFCKYMPIQNSNVLDFGGGLAHFYIYLIQKKINFNKYFYYDINKNFKIFLKKKYQSNKINFLSSYPLKKKFDFIVMNGVYNYNIKNNDNIIRKDIKKLFKICKKCIGFSFLNNDVDYREKHLFYHNEDQLIKYSKKISNKIIVDKTFGRFETFIFLYK